jgi:glucose-6-phosphate 1-dehydrogenase
MGHLRDMRSLVIFGATGDLAARMLFPSLYFLEADGLLPEGLRIIGSSRGELSDEAFVKLIHKAVVARAEGDLDAGAWARLQARLSYVAADAATPASFEALAGVLKGDAETVFYLSTSPTLFVPIAQALGASGAATPTSRVVIEKPIGRDLKSCNAINDAIGAVFSERRIFRIDHYLGKEAVQNLLALRFANTLFEPLWKADSIDHVQITVAETVGVEGRFGYYDEYGAIRDMVQNHILQLLCLVAMEPPASLDPDSVRNEKVKVLRSLRPIAGPDLAKRTVRGQYAKGVADGGSVPGYLEEAGAHPSRTETFVALQANIDNWRWAGVPFYLRTGKRMPEKASQIVIQFRDVPHSIFGGQDLMANRLVIRLQPEEDISLTLMNKTPSLEQAGGMQLMPLSLNLSLATAFTARRRIAYERLLLEALNDNPTLFVRRDEAEAAWTWIDGIVQGWESHAMAPAPYAAGSWGPAGAFALTERNGQSWLE